MPVEKGQRYKHYKGKTYRVLGVGHHSETGEKVVIYQAEYDDFEFGNNAIWVRPYKIFTEHIEVENEKIFRFTILKEVAE